MRYASLGAGLVVLCVLVAIPFMGVNPYTLHLLSLIGIYAIVAMGLNLVFGYTGQISLGHAAYFAVGAYTSALLTSQLGVSFELSLVAAVLLTAALGLLVGIPSLKLEGSYLAMATIGFGEIIKMLLVNWENLTGGPAGISRIPHPEILGFALQSSISKFYFILTCLVIAFVVYFNLIRSHYGTRFIAVRESSKAASAMGIDVKRTKLLSFVVSTAFAGLAGVLYAHLNRYIAPDAFTLVESINFLIIVVVGGMGTLLGPITGAVIIVYLRESLLVLKDFNMLIYGLALMLLMIFMPRGLIGTAQRLFGFRRGVSVSAPALKKAPG